MTSPLKGYLTPIYEFLEEHRQPGGTLWTAQVLQHAASLHQLAMEFNRIRGNESQLSGTLAVIPHINADEFAATGTYNTLDIYGKTHTVTIPNIGAVERLALYFKGIVELSQAFKQGGPNIDRANQSFLCELQPFGLSSHEIQKQCVHDTPPWQFWKQSWTTGDWHLNNQFFGRNFEKQVGIDFMLEWQPISKLSPEEVESKKRTAEVWKTLSDRLKYLIHRHASKLQHVDKVVCFALGPVDVGKPTGFIQHLAAFTIAEQLTDIRRTNGNTAPVPIFAQDPMYCDGCAEVLYTNLNIQTTTSFSAFDRVDQNTFVVVLAPTGPICPIIADLTLQSGGPAAMLCDKIDDDYMKPEKEEGYYIGNWPTKNLVAWKKKGSGDYFGDAQLVMGMSWDDFKRDFPVGPAQLPKGTEEWKAARRAYADSTKTCFGDAWFYVKQD